MAHWHLKRKITVTIKLNCHGVGRNKDHLASLLFYFNRRPTDDEMRFLHEVMERASASLPIKDD
jgi:hypothetical protein